MPFTGHEEVRTVPAEDVVVQLAEHGRAPDLAVWQTDFGVAHGFGAYTYDLLHGRPNELVWVFSGVRTAHVGTRRWVLTPQRALWIPGGVPSQVVPNRPARGYCLVLPAPLRPIPWREPTLVEVTPMLAELIRFLGQSDLEDAAAQRAHALLYDLLRPASDGSVQIPLPRDARALAVADALLTDPADTRTLDEWADTVFTSAKTLQRLFVTEAGLRFPDWRTQSRLYAALPLLADGHAVGSVAHRVGYASTGGFIEAFRRQFGHTPGEHFARSRGRGWSRS